MPSNRPRPLRSTSFSICYSLTVQSFHAKCFELLTALWNNLKCVEFPVAAVIIPSVGTIAHTLMPLFHESWVTSGRLLATLERVKVVYEWGFGMGTEGCSKMAFGWRGEAAAAYIHSSRGEPHSSPPAPSPLFCLHHVNLEQFWMEQT
jgi:hypothetical protein